MYRVHKSQRGWLFAAAMLVINTAASASPFTIDVNFTGGLTPSQQAIFTTAANTWMNLLPNYQAGINISSLVISASGAAIDGSGGILGSAGPDAPTFTGGYYMATTGAMQFDTADLADMETNGVLLGVILHEMAHVMGLGTLWELNSVYTNGTGEFTGANAIAAYRTEFNQPGALFVPVELGGGAGTANGHWNEVDGGGGDTGILSIQGDLRYELMTGWIGSSYYISDMTVASFVDIGYMSAESEVPEPATMVLIGAGLAFLGFRRRRSI